MVDRSEQDENANETVMFVSETPATRSHLPPPSPEPDIEFVCEEIPEPNANDETSPENDFTIIESGSTAQPSRSSGSKLSKNLAF